MISGNLFTRDYLLEGIERTPQWKAIGASEFSELQERLSHIAHGFLKTELGAALPLRGKKRVSARLRPEGSGRYDFGGM